MTTPSETGGGQSSAPSRPDPGAASEDDVQDLALDLEPAPRSRTVFIVVAVILIAVILAGGVISLVASRRSATYTADDQQKFMAACTASGGEGVRSTCGCIYDQMSVKLPYDRFVAIDAELQSQRASEGADKALQFPSEVEAIRSDCVARSRPTVKEPPSSR